MSRIFDLGMSMLGGMFVSNVPANVQYGVYDGVVEYKSPPKSVKPETVSTIYMCAKILSGTVAMMPINIMFDGSAFKEHKRYYQLRHRMSELYNNQNLMSTIEYQRCVYGNSFVDIRNGKFDLLPIECISDWDFKGENDTLRYKIEWGLEIDGTNRRNKKRRSEWVSAKDVLHFKGVSTHGVMGLPPITAAMKNLQILDSATDTIISFYRNRAVTPMALESTIDSAASAKIVLEGLDTFNRKYGGVLNAGKTVQLPPNTKLTPVQLQFADAELVSTMKFEKDEIANMYGIPSFLVSHSENVQMDIEQQTLAFKQFTVSPIIATYASEFEYKILSKEDVMKGVSVKFDTSVLVETDLMTMANAYGKFIQNGLISPNEASKKIGFDESPANAANYRFVQQQLMPLDIFEMHPAYQSMVDKNIGVDKNKKEESQNE